MGDGHPGGGDQSTTKDARELFGVMEMFYIMIMVMSYMNVYIFQNSSNHILKIGKFVIYRLFLNKAD